MLHVLPCTHVDNQNDTVNHSREAQETVEESILGQGNANDMCCKEIDILIDISYEISCGNEMSSDEADMDLDLLDKLDPAEVEKICGLYERIEDKATVQIIHNLNGTRV